MIGIIDYKAGNGPSVLSAVTHLGYKAELVSMPERLLEMTHIIMPGVGSAGATMKSLEELGLIKAIKKAVLDDKVPFLGVCVGMQILFDYSEEEDTECLGFLPGRVVSFNRKNVRVPQMGWNKVYFSKNTGYEAADGYFYFVNSYYAVPDDKSLVWGIAEYDGWFTAAVSKDNIFGTQFHIEKSGEAGLKLLKGFLSTEGRRM
jgi:imidazole glycerol phosphate synthase, glutamine amidotransferase subunit